MPNANEIEGRAQDRRKWINASGKRVWRHYTWTVLRGPGPQLGAVLGGGWNLKSKLSADDMSLKGHLFSDPFFVLSVQWWALSSPVPATLMTSPSPCSKQFWSESSKPWAKTNIFLYIPLSGIWSWKLIEGLVFFFPQRQRYPYICYPKGCQTL